jgi:hypothetical protein
LSIGDGTAADPEIAEGHAVRRRFFRVMLVGSRAEGTAWNPDHVPKPLKYRNGDVAHGLLA